LVSKDYHVHKDPAARIREISSYPIKGYPDRKISKETMEFFGVRAECSESDGSVVAYHYPYVQDGRVVCYKRRGLPKEFSSVGKPYGFFGQHLVKGQKFLVIVEGEQDTLAARELMMKCFGKSYNVVGLPTGSAEDGTLSQVVKNQLEWLSGFETVCLMLDTDGPGQATQESLGEYLFSHCEVKTVKLPVKDCASMLEGGLIDEWKQAFWAAKVYQPEVIVRGRDLKWEDFRKNKQPGIPLPYPNLQEKTWGLRKGEITVLVAGPGLGKSTLAQEMVYHVVKNHGQTAANIALETSMEDLVNTFVAIDQNIPKHQLWFRQESITDEQYQESFNSLAPRMEFFDWWGPIDSENLIRKMYYYAKACEVDFIMLDHISMAVTGSEDERADIDRLFARMTELVVETGVGVIAVMHLKKTTGKNYNKGDAVDLEDIRGSAGAAQMSWNVWAVERNQQADDEHERNQVRIRVLKNRTIGFTGLADVLEYNQRTGRLDVVTVPEFNQIGGE
jgi:twinkle protein